MNQATEKTSHPKRDQSNFPLLAMLTDSLNQSPKVFLKWVPEEARIFDSSGIERLVRFDLQGDEKEKNLVSEIKKIIKPNIFSLRPECYLGVPSRGFSFRKIDFPELPNDEIRDMVALRLEQELPIPLSEFAWGFYKMEKTNSNSNSKSQKTSVVVALIRKLALGTDWPSFESKDICFLLVPSLIEVSRHIRTQSKSYNVINIENEFTEILHVEKEIPKFVKHFPIKRADWISKNLSHLDDIIRLIENTETILIKGNDSIAIEPKTLMSNIKNQFPESNFVNPNDQSENLISIPSILKSEKAIDKSRCIWMENDEEISSSQTEYYQKRELKKWSGICISLIIIVLSLRYIEPYYKSGQIDLELNALQEQVKWIPEVDKEVSFLQMVDNNLITFEGVIPIISSAVDPQFQLSEIILNRRGDLNITATVKSADQISSIRKKLMETKFFTSIVVESQNPDSKKKNISLKLRGSLASSEIVKAAYQKLIKENKTEE